MTKPQGRTQEFAAECRQNRMLELVPAVFDCEGAAMPIEVRGGEIGGWHCRSIAFSGGSAWQTDFRSRTTGRQMRTAMEVATVRRTLNHTLVELKRAIEHHNVSVAADLYALAWKQAAGAPPSETRDQRAQLQELKKTLRSRSWRDEERRQAAQVPVNPPPQPQCPVVPPTRPIGEQRRRPQAPPRVSRRSSTGDDVLKPTTKRAVSPRTQAPPPVVKRQPPARTGEPEPALLDAGQLLEISTELRPLLEQIARNGATWTLIRKKLKGLPRLHKDDQCVVLWMVDEERQEDEPLLSALVTVGDRQMHVRYPAVAEQLGIRQGACPVSERPGVMKSSRRISTGGTAEVPAKARYLSQDKEGLVARNLCATRPSLR